MNVLEIFYYYKLLQTLRRRVIWLMERLNELFLPFFQELGLSSDGNESAVHGQTLQTVSPGQSPIHVQATNLGQMETVVLDDQRAPSYPAVVAYQRLGHIPLKIFKTYVIAHGISLLVDSRISVDH